MARAICFCGVGSLGSRIAIELASSEFHFFLKDDDRVSMDNIGPRAFFVEQLGQHKVNAMAELAYRKARTVCHPNKDTRVRKIDYGFDLVIDTFDNPASRLLTINDELTTVHVGVGEGEIGSVMWDDAYTPPEVTFQRGRNPICTHMLGKQLIQFTASVAVGSILSYFETGHKSSYIVRSTMEIFRI